MEKGGEEQWHGKDNMNAETKGVLKRNNVTKN